jgi:hypothetical protein
VAPALTCRSLRSNASWGLRTGYRGSSASPPTWRAICLLSGRFSVENGCLVSSGSEGPELFRCARGADALRQADQRAVLGHAATQAPGRRAGRVQGHVQAAGKECRWLEGFF